MPAFVKPDYSRNNFSLIPALVESLLTGSPRPAIDLSLPQAQYDHVVVMLVDAFGWRFFQEAVNRYPLLKSAQALKMTSQFPSTTAAHVTCWHGGLPVGASGVFEWQYYEPEADDIIVPLLYSYSGTMQRDTLKPHGISPQRIYPQGTVYERLAAQGIASSVLQSSLYTPGTYSDILLRGANVLPYKTLSEAVVLLKQTLNAAPRRSYTAFYFDQVDSICHHYGPNSPQLQAEIDTLFTTLDRLFFAPGLHTDGKTLFLLTADHGQVEVSPEETLYINTHPDFAGVERFFRRNRRGEYLVPAGSPRDMFLYIHADRLDEAQVFFAERLTGWAEVRRVDEMMRAGYFGAEISLAFRARVGNLVILPYAEKCVWWYEPGRFEQNFYGHHGGLTPQEMETPLLAWEI